MLRYLTLLCIFASLNSKVLSQLNITIMKKWVVYLLGVLTGFVLGILLSGLVLFFGMFAGGKLSERPATFTEAVNNNDEIKLFDKPGDVVKDSQFEVTEVLYDDAAFVRAKDKDISMDLYLGTKYLLTNKEGKYYYDDEKIEAPKGKVFRQIGIYRSGLETLPIITMMDE